MTVRVVPTLEAMAAVYELSTVGGPSSERFIAYAELGRRGVPVSGYNPMTSKPVAAAVGDLLRVDAELAAEQAATQCAQLLEVDDELDLELVLTVATPGMWTDRVATVVEHRYLGRFPNEVIWWFDDVADASAVRAAAVAQTVRMAWGCRHGPLASLLDAAGCEGLAAALGARERGDGRADAHGTDAVVAAALDVLGEDSSVATMVGVLLGDDAARSMGWPELGIDTDAGRRHCEAAAQDALAGCSPAELLRSRWHP